LRRGARVAALVEAVNGGVEKLTLSGGAPLLLGADGLDTRVVVVGGRCVRPAGAAVVEEEPQPRHHQGHRDGDTPRAPVAWLVVHRAPAVLATGPTGPAVVARLTGDVNNPVSGRSALHDLRSRDNV
jgi:hypothetical protein